MLRWKLLALFVVVSLLLVAVRLGTRQSVTQPHSDGIPQAAVTVIEQPKPTLDDNFIWRLIPEATRVHTVLPPAAARRWSQMSGGEPVNLALVEQTYHASYPVFDAVGGAMQIEGTASVFWVVEFKSNTPAINGKVVGLVRPDFFGFYPNYTYIRNAHFVYHPQLDKFLVITTSITDTPNMTGVSIFEVRSGQSHGAIPMILPERSADWPSQLERMAVARFDDERGFASDPSSDFEPTFVVASKRISFVLGFTKTLDFFAYSPRHQKWASVDFAHVALPSNSDRKVKPPIDPATPWQPVANSEKVIAAWSSGNLTLVEQEFQRKADSGDEPQVHAKGYWVLASCDDVVPQYFLPPDESRRIEIAQIVNIGMPHVAPNYLVTAEIDGTELVIRYYSMTTELTGSCPFEIDTLPKTWPKRMEPTSELRIQSPVTTLESFVAYGSDENLIFEVADKSSTAYFSHSVRSKKWTRLKISSRVQLK